MQDCKYQPLGGDFAISHGSNQLIRCWSSNSSPKFKGTCEIYTISPGSRAVWLNLGTPRQPEARRPEDCRGGPRCSQTAPATRRDCVYHRGTDTRLEQVKLEKIELEKNAFSSKKRQKLSAM